MSKVLGLSLMAVQLRELGELPNNPRAGHSLP